MKPEANISMGQPEQRQLRTSESGRRSTRDGSALPCRAALGAALALAANLACALPYTTSVGTISGRNVAAGQSVDFPQIAESEEVRVTQPSTGANRNMYARASSLGLGTRVIDNYTGTKPLAEAIIDIPDLVFSLLSPTGATHVPVGFSGLLEGVVTFEGTGNVVGGLQVSATLLGTGVSSSNPATYNAEFRKDREAGTGRPLPTGPAVVHEQLEGSALVELGRPIRFRASMLLGGSGDSAFGTFGGGVFSGLFDNSFEFDPNAFFDLPDGVTANSPSLGLVDNRLVAFADNPESPPPGTAPEPGGAALLGLELLGAAIVRGRR